MKAPRPLHNAVAAHPFCGCSCATTVASRSLRGAFANLHYGNVMDGGGSEVNTMIRSFVRGGATRRVS